MVPKVRLYRDHGFGKWLWVCEGKGLAAYASDMFEAYALWKEGNPFWAAKLESERGVSCPC